MLSKEPMYDRANIVDAFSDKKNLLLAVFNDVIAEEDKEGLKLRDFSNLCEYLLGRSGSGKQKRALDIIKKQTPVEIVAFAGLNKWSASWWSCLVRTQGAKSDGNRFLLFLGWSNVKGTQAILKDVSKNCSNLQTEMNLRVADKEKQEYERVVSLENVELKGAIMALPSLKELGKAPETPLLDAFLDKDKAERAKEKDRAAVEEEIVLPWEEKPKKLSKAAKERDEKRKNLDVPSAGEQKELFSSKEEQELLEIQSLRQKRALWS